jgi:hypothetical protein
VDNLLGIDEAVERDSRIVAQVDHGVTPPIVEALLAVDRDGAKDRSCAFVGSPPVLERRRIAAPSLRTRFLHLA